MPWRRRRAGSPSGLAVRKARPSDEQQPTSNGSVSSSALDPPSDPGAFVRRFLPLGFIDGGSGPGRHGIRGAQPFFGCQDGPGQRPWLSPLKPRRLWRARTLIRFEWAAQLWPEPTRAVHLSRALRAELNPGISSGNGLSAATGRARDPAPARRAGRGHVVRARGRKIFTNERQAYVSSQANPLPTLQQGYVNAARSTSADPLATGLLVCW